MLQLIPQHPTTRSDGFVVSMLDPLSILYNFMVISGSYDKRRFNTGLSEEGWSNIVTRGILRDLRSITAILGEKTEKEEKKKLKPGEMDPARERGRSVATRLDNTINNLAEPVKLRMDGPLDGVKSPNAFYNGDGGFGWLFEAGAFGSGIGATIDPGGFAGDRPLSSIAFPAGLFDSAVNGDDKQVGERAFIDALGMHLARQTIAMRTLTLKGATGIWGPEFWASGDPRNRSPDHVADQRAVNLFGLVLTCMLQPYLLLYRNVARFVLAPEVRAFIERRHDSYITPLVLGKMDMIQRQPLLPIVGAVDAYSCWGEVETEWGAMRHYPLISMLSSMKEPTALFERNSPFMLLTDALDDLFKSPVISALYTKSLGVLGISQGGGQVKYPGPLMAEVSQTDGLFASDVPADPRELLLRLWYGGDKWMMDPETIYRLNDDRIPTLLEKGSERDDHHHVVLHFAPDMSEHTGQLYERNNPLKIRPIAEYQGDVGAVIFDSTPAVIADLFSVTPDGLASMILADRETWSHIFIVGENGTLVPKSPVVFMSPRTSAWWTKAYRIRYFGPLEWRRWIDGRRMDALPGADRAKLRDSQYIHGVKWMGYSTAERPTLGESLEGLTAKLLQMIEAVG